MRGHFPNSGRPPKDATPNKVEQVLTAEHRTRQATHTLVMKVQGEVYQDILKSPVPSTPYRVSSMQHHSSEPGEQAPLSHILTDLIVIPRASPSPHVGSHVPTSLQKVHCALVASSSHGFPPLLSLQDPEVWSAHLKKNKKRVRAGSIFGGGGERADWCATHANHPFLAPTATFRMR